jgi:AcrR family transcriptional regulator
MAAGREAQRGDRPDLTVVGPAGGTTQVILDTATRLFAEHGYDATSLRQIADAVGTTKAALYYHFPAKEDLLLALTRPVLDGLGDLVTRLRAAPETDAATALGDYLDLFVEHLAIIHLLARDPATQNHPDVGPRARLLVESIQRHVSGPDPSAEQVVRAGCAMGVVHAVGTLPHDLVRRHRAEILDAALAALAPPGRQAKRRR